MSPKRRSPEKLTFQYIYFDDFTVYYFLCISQVYHLMWKYGERNLQTLFCEKETVFYKSRYMSPKWRSPEILTFQYIYFDEFTGLLFFMYGSSLPFFYCKYGERNPQTLFFEKETVFYKSRYMCPKRRSPEIHTLQYIYFDEFTGSLFFIYVSSLQLRTEI